VKRILITGGSSYLGRRLVRIAAKHGRIRHTYYRHNLLDISGGQQLDVRDGTTVRRFVTTWKPDVIIHTAGSNRTRDMKAVICQGAENLTEAAAIVKARLIHISSDVIFDGRKAPYRESDPPMPVHAYGRAKAVAEGIVKRHKDHVIIRTSLIYGLEEMDHSTAWTATKLRQGQPVTLYDDQLRNPVWVETLCQACLQLVDSDYCGILNVAGNQVMSRAEYGLKLLDWWGVEERDTLTIGPSSKKWPVDCRLDLALAKKVLSVPLLGVDQVLDNHQTNMTQD